MNAQGEDVVAGIRTPHADPRAREDYARGLQPAARNHDAAGEALPDMQDFEFTIQDERLYMLQTRSGKRTGTRRRRVAIQMVDEGLITKEEAIFRVEPESLYQLLAPESRREEAKMPVLATGLPASPGAASGRWCSPPTKRSRSATRTAGQS